MTVETPPPRPQCLSKQLLKEKVQCPGCNSTMALRTLRFKHACPQSKTVDLEARKAKMLQRAIEAHARRQGGRAAEESAAEPQPESRSDGGLAGEATLGEQL